MIPVGTRGQIIARPGISSWTARQFNGEVVECLGYDETGLNMWVHVGGTRRRIRNREFQVLEYAPTIDCMTGPVTIGDTVAWPTRGGSNMDMVLGRIIKIVMIIDKIDWRGETTFDIKKKHYEVHVVTAEGKEHRTSRPDRMVKVCHTTT